MHQNAWPQWLRMLLLGEYPKLAQDEQRTKWDNATPEARERAMYLLKFDFDERTGSLRMVVAIAAAGLTALALLVGTFQINASRNLIHGVGEGLACIALIAFLWSITPGLKVFYTDFQDPGQWVWEHTKTQADQFLRLRQDVSNRNHILQQARRLHAAGFILTIISLVLLVLS